jgi:hypothetical protein
MNDLEPGTPVAYEPCACFRADDEADVCAECGWAEDDHEAVVVAISTATTAPLRAAS